MREKNIDFDLVSVRMWEYDPGFLSLNPLGDVPVLVDQDRSIVCEGFVIAEYVDEKYPSIPPLLGRRRSERNEIRRIEVWFDTKFYYEVTKNLMYEKILKKFYEGKGPDSNILRLGRENITFHLEYISYLVERRRWLAGDNLSVADFSAAGHLSTLDYLGDVPWSKFPEAKDWYARLKSRPCFRSILQDTIPAIVPPPHYADLDF